MDSDPVGLRTLADAGLSLNDCSDLFIHQADCDKAASSARTRRRNPPRPQSRSHLRVCVCVAGGRVEGRPAELRAAGLFTGGLDAVKTWSGSGERPASEVPGTR